MHSSSFTARADGLLKVLITDVHVCQAFDPHKLSGQQTPDHHTFKAIWDTGATGTVISQNVVDKCGLAPIGLAKVCHAHGESQAEVYFVNILLPHNVGIAGMRVTKGVFNGFDLLIGMDIISRGDMAVTNKDGKTVFSFRMPSCEVIDFLVTKPFVKPQPHIGRNDKCPCGSGKKYKKCCLNK